MADEIGCGSNEGSFQKFEALRITSLDEDEEDDDQVQFNGAAGGGNSVSDEDEEDELPVTLGFVEKPNKRWSLLRQLFPSKAGGVPAWLDPVNLPSGRSCCCDICGQPLQFMLQVYAPLAAMEATFHRTLFVFMCPSMTCLLRDQHEQWKRQPEKPSRSLKIFRCQLERVNPFYSSDPPRHDGTDKPSSNGAALCNWCGTWKGDKACGGCKKRHYCSEKHQVMHWKSGHKTECRQLNISPPQTLKTSPSGCSSDVPKVASKNMWTEFEIINEDECDDDKTSEDIDYDKSLVSESRPDDSMKSIMENFEGDSDRQSWASFQVRISRAPDQVLRYSRDERAKPLWPMSSGRPSTTDIPRCCYCGGPRTFEIQILPQLLYYFGVNNEVDSLDWATIVVYTCQASCGGGSGSYKEEFGWVQLVTQSTTS